MATRRNTSEASPSPPFRSTEPALASRFPAPPAPPARLFEGVVDESKLAFERTRAARAAIHPKAVVKVNRKIAMVTGLAILAVHRVAPLRATIASSLAAPDLTALDRLRDAALALRYADHRFDIAKPRENPFVPVLAEAIAIRKSLLLALAPLVDQRFIPREKNFRVGKSTALRELATDLDILVNRFVTHWDRIASKTAITKEHLNRAAILATTIGQNSAGRRQKKRPQSELSDDRDRAFTLLLHTYSEVRRMVAYVRHRERDAARFAPSLYSRPKKRQPKTDAAPLPAFAPAPHVEPAPLPAPESPAPIQVVYLVTLAAPGPTEQRAPVPVPTEYAPSLLLQACTSRHPENEEAPPAPS